MTNSILLAGGCFWCIEAVFASLKGVHSAQSGYSNGHTNNPSYPEVCTGQTGHAEVVKVEYDPSLIDTQTLLTVFFAIHDPTQLNRQGHDVGTQYRSGIYYMEADQANIAQKMLIDLQHEYQSPIVTEILPAGIFYPAEAEHDQYFAQNPNQPYCAAVIGPKFKKARDSFAHLWQ